MATRKTGARHIYAICSYNRKWENVLLPTYIYRNVTNFHNAASRCLLKYVSKVDDHIVVDAELRRTRGDLDYLFKTSQGTNRLKLSEKITHRCSSKIGLPFWISSV